MGILKTEAQKWSKFLKVVHVLYPKAQAQEEASHLASSIRLLSRGVRAWYTQITETMVYLRWYKNSHNCPCSKKTTTNSCTLTKENMNLFLSYSWLCQKIQPVWLTCPSGLPYRFLFCPSASVCVWPCTPQSLPSLLELFLGTLLGRQQWQTWTPSVSLDPHLGLTCNEDMQQGSWSCCSKTCCQLWNLPTSQSWLKKKSQLG